MIISARHLSLSSPNAFHVSSVLVAGRDGVFENQYTYFVLAWSIEMTMINKHWLLLLDHCIEGRISIRPFNRSEHSVLGYFSEPLLYIPKIALVTKISQNI